MLALTKAEAIHSRSYRIIMPSFSNEEAQFSSEIRKINTIIKLYLAKISRKAQLSISIQGFIYPKSVSIEQHHENLATTERRNFKQKTASI